MRSGPKIHAKFGTFFIARICYTRLSWRMAAYFAAGKNMTGRVIYGL